MSLGLWAIDSVQGTTLWTSFYKAFQHVKHQAVPKGTVRIATLAEFARFNHVNLKEIPIKQRRQLQREEREAVERRVHEVFGQWEEALSKGAACSLQDVRFYKAQVSSAILFPEEECV